MSAATHTASESPAIGALAPWFGAKRNLAPAIVEELGPHRCYWEPFCGSCSVLLAKPVTAMETVSDLHGDLTNVGRVVQNEALALELYGRLSRTLMDETLFREAALRVHAGPVAAGPDLERAADYLVTALLARVEDRDGTAIYVDPPYLVKGAKYVHDFAADDHARLAELLGRFRASRVVVSYYADERLEELYPRERWRRREIPVTKALVSAGQRDAGNKVMAIEVLLVNDGRRPTLF